MTRRVSGRQIEANYVARTLEEKLDDPLTVRCQDCAWNVTGPLRKVIDSHRKHRLKKHPGRPAEARTTKQRTLAFGQLSTKRIAENIANVRAQGGHTYKQDPYDIEDAA